ncbi:MAG: hypothetical protein AAGB00_06020 [Planctomycetota bacterium]
MAGGAARFDAKVLGANALGDKVFGAGVVDADARGSRGDVFAAAGIPAASSGGEDGTDRPGSANASAMSRIGFAGEAGAASPGCSIRLAPPGWLATVGRFPGPAACGFVADGFLPAGEGLLGTTNPSSAFGGKSGRTSARPVPRTEPSPGGFGSAIAQPLSNIGTDPASRLLVTLVSAPGASVLAASAEATPAEAVSASSTTPLTHRKARSPRCAL